ncbi:unnamed protein product [Echinostoma caproni]|uniref:DUF5753 domain-containing protein n=1 Tax=Echinostoma caproni TaxID=27848 RepID=A0A183AL03_9TREM|nr:unnamed protein product [Echinostoma caproni]
MLDMRQRPLLLAAHREIWDPAYRAAELEPLPNNEQSVRLDVSTMTTDLVDGTVSKPSVTDHIAQEHLGEVHSTRSTE